MCMEGCMHACCLPTHLVTHLDSPFSHFFTSFHLLPFLSTLCLSFFSVSVHPHIYSLTHHPSTLSFSQVSEPPFTHPAICPSTHPSVHAPIQPSVHPPSICPCTQPSRLSIPHPSVHAPNPASQCFLNTCWLSAKGNAKEYHQISIIPRSYQFYSGV